MISEKEFAGGFPGFWAEALPFLTPQVVGDLNRAGRPLAGATGAKLKPLKREGDASESDFVAETAFELFATVVASGRDVLSLAADRKLLGEIASNSISRLLGLRTYWKEIGRKFPKTPDEEAVVLATRMEDFFSEGISSGRVTVQPVFKGCGILDSCFGDVLCPGTLYEIKTVDRNLRSSDLRQALTYCALNYRSKQYQIETVSILNPRRAVEHRFKVEALAARIARRTSAELFHQITEFLANFELMQQV